MITLLFSVRDNEGNNYLPLFSVTTEAQAIRSFTSACNDSNSDICKYPKAFDLVHIGQFDQLSGTINRSKDGPRFIINGASAKSLFRNEVTE